ncbi:MAG: signal peptidase I [Mollicutes bacterium]|nr:signal peptidase I [Mollicutes bacterium]
MFIERDKIVKKAQEILFYIILIILVIIIRAYIITPVRVDGSSMSPTLNNNQILLLKKFDKKVKRFEIVVIEHDYSRIIKRVIGLPGEHIKYVDNTLYINNQIVLENFSKTTSDFDLSSLGYDVIPEGYYFVMGDNRNISLDSRTIGLIKEDEILGTTSFSIYPFNRFGFIE